MSGTSITLPAPPPATAGAAVTIRPGAVNLASGMYVATHDPGGVGAVANLATLLGTALLQSFSVTCTNGGVPGGANNVRVQLVTLGRTIYLLPGQSVGWSVAQEGSSGDERLDKNVIVTCSGDSSAAVLWSEQGP